MQKIDDEIKNIKENKLKELNVLYENIGRLESCKSDETLTNTVIMNFLEQIQELINLLENKEVETIDSLKQYFKIKTNLKEGLDEEN